jgi:hypothetical protein
MEAEDLGRLARDRVFPHRGPLTAAWQTAFESPAINGPILDSFLICSFGSGLPSTSTYG